MVGDKEKIKTIRSSLSAYSLRDLGLAALNSDAELRFHQYVKGICQRLLGDTLDLDEKKVMFALSDKPRMNAFHFADKDFSIIYFTANLLDVCENEDQLAFILGHELGHYEEFLRQGADEEDSKAEETACDLRAIQKMARGGYNLEEACNIAGKLFSDRSINIESLKDPHTNAGSRINLINAMKKKERDRVVEEQNIEVTESTPIAADILKMVRELPKAPLLSDVLLSRMRAQNTTEEKVAVWLKAFHDHIFPISNDGGSFGITEDDAKDLASCIQRIAYDDEAFPDMLLAAIFADMESKRGAERFDNYLYVMRNVLDEVWSSDAEYSYAVVNADEPESKSAAWMRRYLRGFREATGEKFAEMVNNLDYINTFMARHNFDSYKGIYVKNFNLLELDFNQEDVGKRVSPEILKYIRSHINAKDKFVTFSGMVAHKMSDNLVLTHEKKQWSLFVDANGEIAYSFPAQDLSKMQTKLMGKIIENAQKNVDAVANGKINDMRRRLDVLKEAYNIILPADRRNDLRSVIEIRDKKESNEDILLSDVMAILPEDTAKFFAERMMSGADRLPYSEKIVDLLVENISTAPLEYFNEIMDTVLYVNIQDRLCGQDKLLRAVLDNPEFAKKLQETIKSYEPFPDKSKGWEWESMLNEPDFEVRCRMLSLIERMRKITDYKLKEHLENGGNFDDFEQPYKQDLAKLFGFAPVGEIDEQNMLENLVLTRNRDYKDITLYEKAFVTYSSYDALKSDTDSDAKLLLGYNCAGVGLALRPYAIDERLKDVERYHVDDAEQKQMQQVREQFLQTMDTVRKRLVERITEAEREEEISVNDVWNMTLRNDETISRVNGKDGFDTLVSNQDFKGILLKNMETGVSWRLHTCILSLSCLTDQEQSTSQSDAYKESLWPSIEKMFQRSDLDILKKTELFQALTEHNVFSSDYKRYYEVLIGKDGKSGLLADIEKMEDPDFKFICYKNLLNKDARVPDPEIRADIIKKAAYNFWIGSNSYNDIEATEEDRYDIRYRIQDQLKDSDIAELDKVEVLKELSELTMSQKELSLFMKPETIDMQTTDAKAIVAAYGLDVVAYGLQHYPKTKVQIQDFLLGEGKIEDAVALVKELKTAICEEHDKYYTPKVLDRFLHGEDISADLRYGANDYFKKLTPQVCLHFKKEFDAAPLEAKALVVNEIITSGSADWNEPFKIVAEKLFADAGELGKVGEDFLHSYIAARPQSEKTFYLAAMMAAANNKNKSSENYGNSPYSPEERSLAKGLRLFLENSGPAGTKLAQAMSSYQDVPEFIRYEMQFAKSEANPPARWEIFSGDEETLEKLSEYGALGKRRGSASFFVTYDLGDKIVKIMRRGAKLKADSEFGIYAEMLHTLSDEYENISSFKRLVQNAAENVKIETDLDVGEKQYKDAKKLYPENVVSNGVDFKIKVMDWVAHDKNWAIMDKAQGVDFKELEEPYKTAAAKAVFSTELANMLSGKRFDFDRHGGQYKFDAENNVIGVFDTGSMSMVEPTEKEREALGAVLARTLVEMRHNPNVAAVFSAQIDKVTKEFYGREVERNKPVPPYLSEFQRGMLALNDFYAPLSGKDVAECMMNALDNGKNRIHPQIVKAFKREIEKGLNRHNITIKSLLKTEKEDKLAPEARANRRIGKIFFEVIYKSLTENQKINIPSDAVQKLVARLSSRDSDLQIVKGVIRGAYAKLNPANYSKEDREELGMFLYEICRANVDNQKFSKGKTLDNIIAQTLQKRPQTGEYTKNIMKLVAVMSKIPNFNTETLKKAAMFVTFADKDVSQGFKKALKEDKDVGIVKRTMLKLAPLDFVPRNAKKLLIKSVNKRFLLNYVLKQTLGNVMGSAKSTNDRN